MRRIECAVEFRILQSYTIIALKNSFRNLNNSIIYYRYTGYTSLAFVLVILIEFNNNCSLVISFFGIELLLNPYLREKYSMLQIN